jgi:diguanylate cyclase (GGDEF)-like protein
MAIIENLESIKSFFRQSAMLNDQEQLIQKHILQVSQLAGNMPALYFRFLPQQMSFVHHHSVWLQIEQLRQVGFHTESFDSSALGCLRDKPKNFLPLREFVEQFFQVSQFEAFSHIVQNEIRGLVLVLNQVVDPVKILKLQIFHEIFQAQFNINERLKENHSLQTLDATTGLLNRKTFVEKTKHEVSRARRIEQPLAMMIFEIDHFKSLVETYGEANMQLLVKALAKSIQKNFRTIDILARTQNNEFSLLLPHTDLKNAAIKAEKMRRAFSGSRLPFVQETDRHQFSLSIGVSEYPSLSSDSESLFRSADDALQKVKSKNGNSVLTWQAEDDFTPDFIPMPREKLSDDAASK